MPLVRAKESYGEELELVPVRLIGGFVCVDSHLGCAGCGFCLNRRYPAQRRVLEARAHRAWAEAGWPPERIARLAAGLPAIRAGVPVRFGHASDLAFQADGAVALLEALPRDRAALLLTRFPPAAAIARAVGDHPGALLHLSVAPAVGRGIGCAVDVRRALAAAAEIAPDRLFVLFGPLVEGCTAEVTRLLARVPRGAAVGFKALSADGLPFETAARPLPAPGLADLARRAQDLGLEALPMAGCRLHRAMRRPFFRRAEVAAASPAACAGCANQPVCSAARAPGDGALTDAAAALGLSVRAIRRGPRRVLLEVDAQAARADEVFLSERLGHPIELSTVGRARSFRIVQLPPELFARWERSGVYPAGAMRRAAARMGKLLAEAARAPVTARPGSPAASGRTPRR